MKEERIFRAGVLAASLASIALTGCDRPFGFNFSGSADVTPRTPVAGAPGPATGSETPIATATTPAATPKKGETPTPTTPGQSGVGIGDRELKSGECFQAPGNSVVQGDVMVDGVRYYDNDPRSGAIVQLGQKDGTYFVCAPWGADVIMGISPDVLNSVVGQAVEEMKVKGCDPNPRPGCNTVNVVKLPKP